MDIGKRFDSVAREYDTPDKIKRSEKLVEFIFDNLPVSKNWKVLDFGCGTGITALMFSPNVSCVVGTDLSKGMLEVFKEKIEKNKVKNIKIYNKDILKSPLAEKDFDLIITSMTFHHIENIKKALEILKNYLKSGGYIVISDLEKEDGSFHSDNTDVKHFGFSEEEIKSFIKNSGLEDIKFQTLYEISKERDGKIRKYPVFIALARKP